jgi:Tfp pilus assembly protein PilX
VNGTRARSEGEDETHAAHARARRRTQRGAALITTLVAIAVLGLLSAGVGSLLIGHYSRVTTDQNAAKSLNYAEAALNYQIQRLSINIAKTQGTISPTTFGTSEASPLVIATGPGASPAGPMNGTLPLPEAGDVVAAWVAGVPVVGGQAKFDPYSTGYNIYGKATVNGVTRYVRAKAGGGTGLFDNWTLFGETGVELIGNLSVQDGSGGGGVVGSNGPISINGSASAGSQAIYGPGGVADADFPSKSFKDPIILPTISEIANDISGGTTGINYFVTNNDNLAYGTSNGSPLPTAGVDPDKKTIVLNGKPGGANFYLPAFNKKLDIKAIVSDTQPVNLWISVNAGETINAQSFIRAVSAANASPTLADAKNFHIYYRNPNSAGIHLNGGAGFYAMFYAIDQSVISDPNSTRIGTVDMNGNTDYNGAIYAHTIAKSNGNAAIKAPSNIGIQPGEGIVFYGILQPWMEYNPERGNN